MEGLTQGYTSRYGALIQPEGHPGDDDQHTAGYVNLDEIVAELSFEEQIHLQTAVLPCRATRKSRRAGYIYVYTHTFELRTTTMYTRIRLRISSAST